MSVFFIRFPRFEILQRRQYTTSGIKCQVLKFHPSFRHYVRVISVRVGEPLFRHNHRSTEAIIAQPCAPPAKAAVRKNHVLASAHQSKVFVFSRSLNYRVLREILLAPLRVVGEDKNLRRICSRTNGGYRFSIIVQGRHSVEGLQTYVILTTDVCADSRGTINLF
jgi:hypothetical protein